MYWHLSVSGAFTSSSWGRRLVTTIVAIIVYLGLWLGAAWFCIMTHLW